MLPRLGQVLQWAACWIAVVVVLLALAAWTTGARESWSGVITFSIVAVSLWLLGRVSLLLSDARRRFKRRSFKR